METCRDIIGDRWFCNTFGQEHIVTFNPIGSDYLIINIETGQCLQGGTMQQTESELERNFHQ